MPNRVILVADDEKDVREVLSVVLSTELGARVLLAPDGQRLVDLVDHVRPAVVVTDVRMPKLDGLEAVRRLSADPRTAHVPVVVISAYCERHEALDAGAAAFVAKPFQLDDVVRLLGRLLRESAGGTGLPAYA